MSENVKKRITELSQTLRKNMTKEERHLWYDFLKTLPQTVHRQKPFGPYIVDFYCASANVVIEIDGTQHYEEKGKANDRIRDVYLAEKGITVLRYSMPIYGTILTVYARIYCETLPPHPSPQSRDTFPPRGKAYGRLTVVSYDVGTSHIKTPDRVRGRVFCCDISLLQ